MLVQLRNSLQYMNLVYDFYISEAKLKKSKYAQSRRQMSYQSYLHFNFLIDICFCHRIT